MQRLKEHSHWAALLAALLALGSIGFTVTQTTTTTPGGGHVHQITVRVDRSGEPGMQPQTLTVPAPVVNAIAPNLEQDLRNESPPGTTPTQTAAITQAADKIKAALPALPTAGATMGVPGCRTEFISSYSSRLGVRPTQFWLHYTVSPNVTGWADVNSVVHLFANPNNQASSNFVIDGEGHCAYIVPVEFKAWTQAGANRFAVSFEIIDTGKESSYLAAPGLARLRSVVHVLSRRLGIPLRRGVVSNCTPIRSGIVQHYDGGVCAGGHYDIRPFDMAVVVKQLAAGGPRNKKVVWVKHRKAIHGQYQRDCKRRVQRGAHRKECRGLRVRARRLEALIRRGSK